MKKKHGEEQVAKDDNANAEANQPVNLANVAVVNPAQKAEEEKKSAERNAIKAKLIKGEHLSKEELAQEAAAAFEAMQQKRDKNKKPQLLKG